MTASLAQLAANAMADALTTYVGSTGKIIIYDGDVPANADASLSSNTALATFTLGSSAFGSASSGTISLSGVPLTVAADATGTASFFRITKSDGTTVVAQGSVGTSGAQLNLNTVAITEDVNVTITSGSINMPT
jgi:hypothetical protein